MDRRKQAGNFGEIAALGYLAAKGYVILAQNYRAWGKEIDIIAKDGDYIIFVEVKYRKQLDHGRPAEAITKRKRDSLVAAAYGYLAENGRGDENCRFDIIEIFGREQLHINHVENAFGEN